MAAPAKDQLYVRVLTNDVLPSAAHGASYAVTLACGFWQQTTPFASASGGALAGGEHDLQIPKDSATDVLKVALVERNAGVDAEVASCIVELRELGVLTQPGVTEEHRCMLSTRDGLQEYGAVHFALHFERAAVDASVEPQTQAAAISSTLPAGWRPTPYDRLSGTWHAAGVADGSAEVEEEFVLKVTQEQLPDGTWSSACAGGNVPGGEEDFAMVELSLGGAPPNQTVSFIQRYPDGAETQWSAVLAADHSSMYSGNWHGACNGTFICQRTPDEQPAPAPAPAPVPDATVAVVTIPTPAGPKTPRSPTAARGESLTPPTAAAPPPAVAPRPTPEAISAAVAGPEEGQQTLEQQADRFEELSQALDRAMHDKAAEAARGALGIPIQQPPQQQQPDAAPEPVQYDESAARAASPNPAQLRRQRQAEAQRRHAERLGSPPRRGRGTSPAPPNRRTRGASPAGFGSARRGLGAGTSPRRDQRSQPRGASPAQSRPPFGRAASPAANRSASARNLHARSHSPAPLPRVAQLGPSHVRRAITTPDRSRARSAGGGGGGGSGGYRSQSPAAPRGFGSSSKRIPSARGMENGIGSELTHGDL